MCDTCHTCPVLDAIAKQFAHGTVHAQISMCLEPLQSQYRGERRTYVVRSATDAFGIVSGSGETLPAAMAAHRERLEAEQDTEEPDEPVDRSM